MQLPLQRGLWMCAGLLAGVHAAGKAGMDRGSNHSQPQARRRPLRQRPSQRRRSGSLLLSRGPLPCNHLAKIVMNPVYFKGLTRRGRAC